MLFRSQEQKKEFRKLLKDVGKRNDPAAFARVLELDPHCGPAYLALGKFALDAGRFAEAEKYYWDGLAEQPCSYSFFFALAELRTRQGLNDELTRDLTLLAF